VGLAGVTVKLATGAPPTNMTVDAEPEAPVESVAITVMAYVPALA